MLKLAGLYRYSKRVCLIGILFLFGGWGFFGHQRINRLAVFALPPEMIGFYKKNIGYITETAVNPDRRRFIVADEAPRHYIDLDHYGDSALYTLPRYWKDAVEKLTEDTLKTYGILPWHINRMYYALKDAFVVRDVNRILKLSAEIGHYIGDAHVPLHTTENYNGQLTGQEGIHAFWESRLPELFSDRYDFFVGKVSYIVNPQLAAWEAIEESHLAVDSVLGEEKKLFAKSGDHKYSFETKGRQTQKVFSQEYSKAYHAALQGMVERRMRAAIKLTADIWYTAWVDAGQPDLNELLLYQPSEEEIRQRKKEQEEFNQAPAIKTRTHEI
ncbi:zinc dependent phospholipase C family protein [Ohtaekwangia sp.]|uniref:zinc dependent phospholipase C family protein n=1 Tax=Ohtaekwangia sp. TaxID=2066019 RepID=UPI002F92EFD4